MKYYSRFLTFLLASSSAFSISLLPSYAMEGQQDKDAPGLSRSGLTASPTQDTKFIPECFAAAAEFDQDRGSITPSHVLNRYLLLGSYLGNHTEEKRKELTRSGIQNFMDKNYNQSKPILEKAALYGDISSMIHLGHIYKMQGNPFQALQWYTLAFQTTLENTGRGSNPTAIKFIKQLNTPEANDFLKQLDPCFLEDEKNPRTIERQQFFTVEAFGNLESYLFRENNSLRAWKCRLQLRQQLKTLGRLFWEGHLGKIYPEDIRLKRAAQLFCEVNDPASLECLGNMLFEKKITPIELHEMGALPQPFKQLEIGEVTSLNNFEGAAIFFASAKTPPSYHVLGSLLPIEPTILEILQKSGFLSSFLKELGIDEVSSLTHYELSALLSAKAGAPESLFNLADNLHKHKLTLQDLKEKGALSPLLRMLGVEESPSLGDVSLAAHLFVRARIPAALNSLGSMLHKEMIKFEELKTIGVFNNLLDLLGIKESSSLTPSLLAAHLFAIARIPETLDNLGFMLDKQKVTIKELKTSEILPQLLNHLGIKDSPSLTSLSLAALLYARAGIPDAYFKLGNMCYEKKVTVKQFRTLGILPQLLNNVSNKKSPSLLALRLFEMAGIPDALYNLGLLYLSNELDLPKEEKIQRAEKSFRAANSGAAKHALAYLYLTCQLEESLDAMTRCQKAFSLLESAILEGSEKAKELLNLAVELFVLEQEKISALEEEESLLPVPKSEDLPPSVDELPPLLETNEQALTPVLSEEKGSLVVPVQVIDSGEKEEGKDKSRKIVRKKEKSVKIKKSIQALKEKIKAERASLKPITDKETKPQNFVIEFDKPKVERDYYDRVLYDDSDTSKKIRELIDYIKNNPLDEKGPGKPKPLKGPFLGWWERYIDGTNRLVYCIKKGKIIIYSFDGHL